MNRTPTDYEHVERSRVLSRDWSRVHIEADKRKPFGKLWERS
jgi:hypothetical protein